MIINKPTELDAVLDKVHDLWFDVDRVAIDPKKKVVTILLQKQKAKLADASATSTILRINNAEELLIKDTEKVKFYDLNEIKYDGKSNRLFITGGIPIGITIRVNALEIEVESSEDHGRPPNSE